MSRRPSILLTGTGLALAMSACTSPQVGSPCPPGNLSSCVNQGIDKPISATAQKDLDILFLIDNSPSMSPKQRALATNIPRFIQKIEATGANYHVGIATSDVGSWKSPGTPWGAPLGTCNSYEGDDGALQKKPCTQRTDLIGPAKTACDDLCKDDKWVPADGSSFISKINGQTNINIPPGGDPTKAAENAFKCMALVGDTGCGLEAQLEGAKRALDGHNPTNNNFLRPNSVLAVIFITDEDDCSVQMARRGENDPTTMDCATPLADPPASCFNADYRCMARDVKCNEPTNTVGLKTGCQERADTYLDPVSKYVNFFLGLRPADKLVVAGIWTTPSVDKSTGKLGQFVVSQKAGSTKSDGLNRDDAANAGCVYTPDPTIIGRPQVRLSKFAQQVSGSVEKSVCDVDNYPSALDAIADKIQTKLKVACLEAVPKIDPASKAPLCIVGDVDAKTPNATPDVAFPVCNTNCCNAFANADAPTADDPSVIAACKGAVATGKACYCAVSSNKGQCKPVGPDGKTVIPGVVAGVWRELAAGQMPPADKVVSFKCAAQ